MPNTTFIKTEDLPFSQQITNFATQLSVYATALGVTADEVESATRDAAFFAYILPWMDNIHGFSTSSTAYKNLARNGKDDEVLGAIPVAPVPGTAPTLVSANIQKRFSDLAARIKKSPNYTISIGESLGINAPDSPFVPGEGKPSLTVKLVEGGFPQIKFVMGEYEGIQLLKSTGSGFTLLNVVNHPTFVDKSGMPAPGQTAIFSYKAIFLYKGVVVGQWSDVVSVTVTG